MSQGTEDSYQPDFASPPGDTLADLLDERAMSQTDLAERLGVSKKHLSQVVHGRATISAEFAIGLERALGVPADFWLTREARYRTRLARIEEIPDLEASLEWAERFPLKDLRRLGAIPADVKGADLVSALLEFLGIGSRDQWKPRDVAFRKSQAFESDEYALDAWLRLGELAAREIECEPFDETRFRDVLQQARAWTRLDPGRWQSLLEESCASAGVALVIMDTVRGARVNGATRWLSKDKALIQLTLRYKWEDVFWFSFFHEAGHLLKHGRKRVFVEPSKRPGDYAEPQIAELEDAADRFAAQTLIPREAEGRLPGLRSDGDVVEFADDLGIAPAIVVGRLHHERHWTHNRGHRLRRKLEFKAS